MIFRLFRKEWVVALLLAALFLAVSQTALFARMDGWLFSFGQQLVRTADKPLANVAIIDIDKASHDHFGGKQFSLTYALEKLLEAEPQAIGILMPLAEPDGKPALEALDNLATETAAMKLSQKEIAAITRLIENEKRHLDSNQRIAYAIRKSGLVTLAMHDRTAAASLPLAFTPQPDSTMQKLYRRLAPLHASRLTILDNFARPDPMFADAARNTGWLSLPVDYDGRSRSFELVHTDHAGHAIGSMPLLLSMAKSADDDAISIEPGLVKQGGRSVKTDPFWRAFIRLYYENDSLALPRHIALGTLLDKDFKASSMNGKVVLIADESMLRPVQQVAGGHELAVADFVAIATANMLNDDLFTRTATTTWLELLLFVAAALVLALAIPRLHYGVGLGLALLLILLLAGSTEYLLLTKQLWLKTALPISLLLIGMLILGLRRLYAAQAKTHQHEVAHTLRQLGLAYQEQNKLDLAFEAFQKLPPQPANLEALYNLALDFERRRRYERAVAAYQHILHHDGNFKDVIARKLNAEKMERSLSMNSGQFTASILLMPDENGLKPQLGRYEVEKELGRGVMGAVYLGRDPKIDRTVAIKTLALSQEFEAEELQEVENRFFHEAAAAGRLNHPNIVTIYDAGEEHDLAYIAMEFIEGQPLSDYVQPKKLLAVETVLNIVAQVAGGLDYAYKQGVVHRDIKPGNIMYNDKSGLVKIADFGIARITSSSRTKTGAILGTPSYMSPEQISSQKVDGRSDIFSLGSTLYTLLTGKKAFSADSIAALSYQITSEKHPDPTKLREGLPNCVKNILDKALQKDPDNRYQDGMAMRRAILRCLKNMES